VRDRRRGGWRHPPSAGYATWRLLWAIAGVITFTVIMLLLDLI